MLLNLPPFANTLLKGLCLLCYALALAVVLGLTPAGSFARTPYVALALLVVHALEVIFMFRKVSLYQGPLALSIVLTLLFGFLHWKPLADRQKQLQPG